MLYKTFGVLGVVVAFSVVVSGCAKGFCESYCEWVDDCVIPIDNEECVEDCIDDYKDEDGDCQSALSEFGDCVESESCGSAATLCVGEATEVAEQCRTDW